MISLLRIDVGQYSGGKFIFSGYSDFIELGEKIQSHNLKLRVTLDIPQLFTEHFGSKQKSKEDIATVLRPLKSCNELIKGLHLWGKRRNDSGRWISHVGNLSTYFDGITNIKNFFLGKLVSIFEDDQKLYFVPEVNSNDKDLEEIIKDLTEAGVTFVF